MHVPIERLYGFVMAEFDLTGEEQSHLSRCNLCVAWLDGCMIEKMSILMSIPPHLFIEFPSCRRSFRQRPSLPNGSV
jgi:hypothetical protein